MNDRRQKWWRKHDEVVDIGQSKMQYREEIVREGQIIMAGYKSG